MELSVVIARYSKRPRLPTQRLLSQLAETPVEVILVENDDAQQQREITRVNGVTFIKRENVGMNIGAWELGSEYATRKNLLYLQDDCFIKKWNALTIIEKRLEQFEDNAILGESLNLKWALRWDELTGSNTDEEIKRAAIYYRNKIKAWGVNPGEYAIHLRSIVMAMSQKSKNKIGPFFQGKNKADCIASEIAISMRAREIGIEILQIEREPFYCFGHPEWFGQFQKKESMLTLR